MRGFALVMLLLAPLAAQAQTKKVEIALGAAVVGGASAGETRTELLDSAGNPVTLFEATHRNAAAPGVTTDLSYRLRPRLAVELSGAWSRPNLKTTIVDDVEGAEGTTLSLGMHRFFAGAAIVRHFSRRGALEPFVKIGAGWIRDLTADRALVDDGVSAHAGGGIAYWLREGRPGLFGQLALRADVRVVLQRGGIELGNAGTRWSPVAGLSLVVAR